MKKIFTTILLFLFLHSTYSQQNAQTVNPVIGDESFLRTYQTIPDPSTDEQLRIKTHLAYVENLLRERNTDHLSSEQQSNRKKVLQLLHDYWTASIFPVNEEYANERRPCFIDRYGNICAVGYLIEKTAGRQFAEEINEKHQYNYIGEMNEESIASWADNFGLSLVECAMIQPQYGPSSPYPTAPVIEQPIQTGYGVTSGILGGVNAAVIMTNLGHRTMFNRVSYIGLVTGTAQLIYGAIKVSSDDILYPLNGTPQRLSYKANNNLSYLNIAAGTATLITSVINMRMNKKSKSENNCFNLYSYPGINNELNMGICFVRRI